jgi:hypothetical protein
MHKDLGGDVLDVALATVELCDASGIDVDEDDALAGVGEGLRERDADVAGSDDGDLALHRVGIVATSTCAIRSEACPSPYSTGGSRASVADATRPASRLGIVVDEHVRALRDGVDPLRRRTDGDARHAVPVRLLLEAAGVRDDHARLRCERGELEVAQRLDQADVVAERELLLVDTRSRARVHREDDHLVDPVEPSTIRRGAAARRSPGGGSSPRRSARLVRHRKRRSRDRCERRVRVGHHVADDVDPAHDASRSRASPRAVVRAEEEPRQAVRPRSGVLLGHRQVSAAEPGLDVRERDRASRRARAPARVEFVSP